MPEVFVLVDDDNDDKEIFKEALFAVDPDILCLCAGDGEEALKKLGNGDFFEPTMIFLDINLPEMSGWELLTKIKRSPQYKHIPIIMYSTSSHKRDKEIAVDLGAVGLITKPNDYKILKDVLAMIVRNLDSNESVSRIKDQIALF